MKLTNKHFAIFKKECKKWLKEFELSNWSVVYQFGELDNEAQIERSSQYNVTLKKAQARRYINFLPKFKEAFELQTIGKKLREIALIQGISRRQVSDRILRYKEYLKSNK